MMSHLVLSFRDEAVEPAVDLGLQLERLTVTDVIKDPERPDAALRFHALVRSPGVWDALTVEGTAVPFAAEKTFEARVDVAGIVPGALDPYLDSIGAESTWEGGTFSLTSRGALELKEGGGLGARFEMENVTLRDGEELLGVDRIAIDGVDIDPGQSSFGVASVKVERPRLTGRRDADGALEMLGIRLDPSRQPSRGGAEVDAPAELPESAPAEEEPTPLPAAEPPAGGRFRVGEISLTEARFLGRAMGVDR